MCLNQIVKQALVPCLTAKSWGIVYAWRRLESNIESVEIRLGMKSQASDELI